MSNIVIKLSNVLKRFKLYDNPITGPVKDFLFFWREHQYYQEFIAVKDVSMEIKRGEIVGIIGPNGAGKTTILKMIAGLLPVDAGRIEVKGKVTALLALGVGINPEFTGKENIFYSGLLLGMSKDEILKKMPSIIEFAELGNFIDRPLRTYSSGMRARLLFATSMSIDPDILIVDEALATGDSYFVEKSTQRIRDICNSGATILFVSHNLSQIQQLCERVYLIAEGEIIAEGDPTTVISNYNDWVFKKEAKSPAIMQNIELKMTGGAGEIMITEVKIKNAEGKETTGFYTGESMNIEISYISYLKRNISVDLFVGFLLFKSQEYIGQINTECQVEALGKPLKSKKVDIYQEGKINIFLESCLLLNNTYSLWIIMYDNFKYYCEYKNIRPFFISRKNNSILRRDALFWHPFRIEN